jgi:methionyl-tRNA formyltransferase
MEQLVDEPIVFFGTGPVAAESLKFLAQSFIIEVVVTKPRPAHHHGDVPVLDMAKKLRIPIVEVANKKEATQKITTELLRSRLAVLIDFGIIIEQKVIDVFPLGIVNSHFSLLPQWRGADPITFSILSGQDKTGVSLMLLVEAMDEGPLLSIGELDLDTEITTPELTARLIDLSYALLRDTLPKYITGEIAGAPQEKVATAVGYSIKPTYSRKLTKEDGILDWDKTAIQLDREIRAYLEWPKSRSILGGHAIIVTKAHAEAGSGTPGKLWQQNKSLGIYCRQGVLMIDRIKPAGKGEMSTEAFLNGYGKDLPI